jgi:hypothetical protein
MHRDPSGLPLVCHALHSPLKPGQDLMLHQLQGPLFASLPPLPPPELCWGNPMVRHLQKTGSGGWTHLGGLYIPDTPLRTVKLLSHLLLPSPFLVSQILAAALFWKVPRDPSNMVECSAGSQLLSDSGK